LYRTISKEDAMIFIFLESLAGLILAMTFGSRLMFRGGKTDTFFTKWVRNPLKNVMEGRIGRMMDDFLLSWGAFILGLWIAIPQPLGMDKGPAVALIAIAVLAFARAGKAPPPKVTHDIEGTATDVTPKAAAPGADPEPASTPGGKAKAA
jgi:hypothetical protein